MEGAQLTFEKPIHHINLAEWHAKQYQNQQSNDQRRDDAFKLRHESRQLRNETRIRTEWDVYHNNVRLGDRITELDKWKTTFEACLDRVNKDMKLLKDEKQSTERELDALTIPLSIITECLSMRDNRQGAELTYDEADFELKKELSIVDDIKKLLVDRCQAAWEKINKLEELRFQLDLEINDMTEAMEIDKDQLTLDKNCANITYKTDPLRIVKNSITYEAWVEKTIEMKATADNQLSDTHKLREALFVIRERSRNDLKAQRERVDFTLRKRIYETQKSRNELEWQVFKMKEEMDKIQSEIITLEQAFFDKIDALKLAETRLENRSFRPGIELERDDSENGLKEEVLQLRRTQQELKNQINLAKENYNNLEDQLVLINRDLEFKGHSLMTDIRCLDMRARLKGGEFNGASSETDRNIQLTHMEDEIPPT